MGLECCLAVILCFSHPWLPACLSGKESCQHRKCGFNPWVGKIPWRRKWQPTPVVLPRKSRGQRSLAGYRPRGHKSGKRDLATNNTTSSCRRHSPREFSTSSLSSDLLSPSPTFYFTEEKIQTDEKVTDSWQNCHTAACINTQRLCFSACWTSLSRKADSACSLLRNSPPSSLPSLFISHFLPHSYQLTNIRCFSHFIYFYFLAVLVLHCGARASLVGHGL